MFYTIAKRAEKTYNHPIERVWREHIYRWFYPMRFRYFRSKTENDLPHKQPLPWGQH
jgi:hypothetical protein